MSYQDNNKIRLDNFLVEQAYFDSRSHAQTAIMSGSVAINGKTIDKAGFQLNLKKFREKIEQDSNYLIIKNSGIAKYVSRGALKLEKAYEFFKLDFSNKLIFDLGSSTGGFTDFALQNGSAGVISLDVGKAQLHQKLRDNPCVLSLEETNFKNFSLQELDNAIVKLSEQINKVKRLKLSKQISYLVADLSFISLLKITDKLLELFVDNPAQNEENTTFILLLKPQFEADKATIDKCQGVIKDEKIRQRIVHDFKKEFKEKFEIISEIESPIKGTKGNIEYLLYCKAK